MEAVVFTAHSNYVLGLLFTPDGQILVSAGMDRTVKLWQAPDWAPIRTIEAHAQSVCGATATWTLRRELAIDTPAVNGMAFSPDGRWLAVGAADKKIRIWALWQDAAGSRVDEQE